MKRTKKKFNVDAILTADWHLREDTPICRTDDFVEAQWEKVKQVKELQEKYDCPVFHAGDLFHHWKTSPELLGHCIDNLPKQFWTVYGNHDLPQHSMLLKNKSGITPLAKDGTLQVLDEGHWNIGPKDGERIPYTDVNGVAHIRRIAIWHKMVWTNKPPFPGAEKEAEGHELLRKYPQFDLIVTGDNHQTFVCKQDGRLLVNPGSLTRQTAGQIDHEPCVWLYDAEQNEVEAFYFECSEDDISRQHIELTTERDERISAFIERLGEDWEGGLDFRENLKRFGLANDVPKKIMNIAFKVLEEIHE